MNELEKLRLLSGIQNSSLRSENLNTTLSGSEKAAIMREKNIRAGSPDWFKLWFAKPDLTGEKLDFIKKS